MSGSYTVTYTVKDNANNTATSTRTVNVVDTVAPTITFGTNGNVTYSKTASSIITVTDQYGSIDTNSLKFLWNLSTTTPLESDFYTWYTNGSNVTIPPNSGQYYLWAMAKDNSGNTTITRSNVFNLDNTNPTISADVNSNISFPFSTWTLSGGAYVNASNQLVLPNNGAIAISPYLPVNGTYWVFSGSGYAVNPSPNATPDGGIMISSIYFNASYQNSYSSNGYQSNGYSPHLLLNQTTSYVWNGWSGYGPDVIYVRIQFSVENYYSVAPVTLSNISFIATGDSNYQKIIIVSASDNDSGIRTKKWLSGSKTVADFASAGTVFTDKIYVSTNGIYTIYVEDNVGNKTVKEVSITGIY
jgi:hypothetical protein